MNSASDSSDWTEKISPVESDDGTFTFDLESSDFPMARIDRIRIGSAVVTVRNDDVKQVAADVMRSLVRQVNGQFAPTAAAQPIEIYAK